MYSLPYTQFRNKPENIILQPHTGLLYIFLLVIFYPPNWVHGHGLPGWQHVDSQQVHGSLETRDEQRRWTDDNSSVVARSTVSLSGSDNRPAVAVTDDETRSCWVVRMPTAAVSILLLDDNTRLMWASTSRPAHVNYSPQSDINYSVSQKFPPRGFLTFLLHNSWK